MSQFGEAFESAVQQIIESYGNPPVIIGTVKSVSGNTCTVSREGYATIESVRLNATSKDLQTYCKITPKVGSKVLVAYIEKSEVQSYIMATTEVELVEVKSPKVMFNDGNNGGLIMIEALIKKINRLEQRLLSHQHTYVVTGSAAITTPDTASNSKFSLTKISDIEDSKITH